MIKKITIISLLTVSILFSSFYVQQKKAEAVVPVVLYVAVTALIHFGVGAYLYLKDQDDSTQTRINHITNIDSGTGEISFELDLISGSTEGVKSNGSGIYAYPEGMLDIIRVVGCTEVIFPGKALYPTVDQALDYFCYNSGAVRCSYIDSGSVWTLTMFYDEIGCAGLVFTAGYDGFVDEQLSYSQVEGGLGGVYDGNIAGEGVSMYDFIEDVPLLPNCFDGIQNQDETGIDCGGVCELNFGFVCPPPPETCFDGIMNQDETGIDYGGVCGIGGDPSPAGPAPSNFIDANVDGIDDLSGYDSVGNVPIGAPGDADGSTYDSSLPGDIEEIGETNWTGLITGYLATNPLVLLATGSSINLSGEVCTLTANVFGTDIVIDFCSMESMIDLIGTFVLGLMAIRSVFIAMGI